MFVKTFFLLACLWMFAGCTGPYTSENGSATSDSFLLDYAAGQKPIFVLDSPVTVSRASAYYDGEILVIAGKTRRLHEIRLPGVIEVVLTNRVGDVLLRETQRIPGLNSNRRGLLERPFRFQLASVPDQAEKIRLQYVAAHSNFQPN